MNQTADVRGTRFALPAFVATAIAALLFLALPAAASAVDFSLTINEEGSGSGTVECEVEAVVEPCEAEYEEGTELVVLAEADEGSEFVEFYGDCGPLFCELTMDEDHVVNVVFEEELVFFPLFIEENGTGSGTVECEVEGGPEECEAEYLEGTQLVLIAEPEEGSEFVEWTGECDTVVGNECEIEMDAEKSVEVTFDAEPEEFALTIEEEGTGEGEVVCEAQEGPQPCVEIYPAGTELILIAQAKLGSEFKAWEGECDNIVGNECEVEMDEDKTVQVVFDSENPTEEFELEVEVTGNGDVDSSPAGILNCRESSGDCEDEYAEGTEVTLTATPDVGNQFEGWTGCDSEPSGNCKVTMDEAKLVEAEFAPIPTEEFELEVEVTGNGDVDSSPAGILNCRESSGDCEDEYAEGTEVTLTATPDVGNQFEGWTGCDSEPAANKCKVTIDEAKLVEAEFAPIPTEEFELEVEVIGNGKVDSSPAGILNCRESSGDCEDEYAEGTEVTLTATPDVGNQVRRLDRLRLRTGGEQMQSDDRRSEARRSRIRSDPDRRIRTGSRSHRQRQSRLQPSRDPQLP